jgi:hypothetical protein
MVIYPFNFLLIQPSHCNGYNFLLILMDIISCSGHTAEGSMNLTSLESTPSDPSVTQNGEDGYNPSHVSLDDDEDDNEVHIVRLPNQSGAGTSSDRPTAANRAKEATALDGGRKVGKRQKKVVVSDVMEKYLEIRTKQVEGEVAEKAKTITEIDEFSMKNCIGLLNTIGELSSEEKADAFDIFKEAINREIFMTAEPIARLIWLRKKIVSLSTQKMLTSYSHRSGGEQSHSIQHVSQFTSYFLFQVH